VPPAPGPRVVALVGPESTGKTTLAAELAAAFGGEWSPESARLFAEARRATGDAAALGPEHVSPIARGQVVLEDAALARARAEARPLLVRDTDLASTVAYARHYYGACPGWIVEAAAARRAELYLLLVPDGADWAPDPVRGDEDAREPLVAVFRAVLDELGCAYAEVGGAWRERTAAARGVVAEFLRTPRAPEPLATGFGAPDVRTARGP
jgi:nicotinamide riboside kinase